MRNIKNGSGTILLGEDELEVRSYLEMALRCQGYSVEMAQDGEELLSCLQNNAGTISAVLLDLVMPRKDGFALLLEFGARESVNFPSIVLTSSRSGADALRSRNRGADMYLVKPTTLGKLTALMDDVIATM